MNFLGLAKELYQLLAVCLLVKMALSCLRKARNQNLNQTAVVCRIFIGVIHAKMTDAIDRQ
jgi:hypothetical protein